nr:MAG TPA: hypothetical protein [Caudoviricetes sp.]
MEQKACEVLDILLENIKNTDSKKRVEILYNLYGTFESYLLSIAEKEIKDLKKEMEEDGIDARLAFKDVKYVWNQFRDAISKYVLDMYRDAGIDSIIKYSYNVLDLRNNLKEKQPDMVKDVDRLVGKVISRTSVVRFGLSIDLNIGNTKPLVLGASTINYYSPSYKSDYVNLSDVEAEVNAIQSRDKTITELKVENERLKLELEQAKKKSKGFFSWLFS